jgi:uncharacterized membrane protein
MKYTFDPDEERDKRNENNEPADEPTVGEPGGEPTGNERPSKIVTTLGTTENVGGMLAYLLGWVTGLIFLMVEKENKFVRFHAMQSNAISVPFTIASIIADFINIHALGVSLSGLVTLAWIFVWLFMMFQAFQGRWFKFPYAGDFAEKQLKSMAEE